MTRADIKPILGRVEFMAAEVERFVPSSPSSVQFRADLAGLLVVSISATYESCVKETLINYAERHHTQFGVFTQNHFKKLNSRISLSDLYNYARNFDNSINDKFGKLIKERKVKLPTRIGKDFTAAYGQILSWRHDFAHAGIRKYNC